MRIRSPQPPSTDPGKVGSSGRTRSKRLVDGRWTLAFPDEKMCKYAQTAMYEEMEIQRSAIQHVLEPFIVDSSLLVTSNKDDVVSVEP